jgi:hypothetical protein
MPSRRSSAPFDDAGQPPRAAARSAFIVGLCLALASCAWENVRSVNPEPKSAQPELSAIESSAKTVYTTAKLSGTLEISELRQAVPSAPADWIVCLRSNAPPARVYAMFFNGNTLASYRLAVLYDDCAREVYVQVAM